MIALLLLGLTEAPPAEVRWTCQRVAGGPTDPKWLADREKFGIAQPVVSEQGDLALDPDQRTLTLFETGDVRNVLRAKRVGTRYVTSTPSGANRPGGYLLSIMRDFEPATGRFRIWLQARAGEDQWAFVDYACEPPPPPEDDYEEFPDDPEDEEPEDGEPA